MNGHASSTVANIFSSNMCKAFISTKNPEDSQHLVPDSFDCIHSHWEMLEDCWMFHVFFTKIRSFTRASDFCSYETNVSPGTLVMLAIKALQEYICSPI